MSSTAFNRSRACLLIAGIAATAALTATTLPAAAAPRVTSTAFTVRSFAAVGSENGPDDITRLGDSIYVSFQNGVGPLGEAAPSGATASTIQEYSLTGAPGRSWSVTGKVDGLTADPEHHRLLLTANEDGNSSFLTLDPRSSTAKRYTYAGLTHGGGTDAISVDGESIIVSASNPSVPTGPAAYRVTLTGTTAALTPVLADNAVATSANAATAGQRVQLALTDPDSNAIVPRSSSRFGGSFMLDSQGDQQLIFLRAGDDSHRKNTAQPQPQAQVLSLSHPVDDTAFATASRRTLWVTDPTHNTVDEISGPFASGEAVSTVTPDSGPTSLARLNLNDGTLAPIPGLETVTPKGLLFTGAADGDHGSKGNDED